MIGILSDAHGNRPAFEKAVGLLQRHGADRLVFLGDAGGYLPSLGVYSVIKELGTQIQCIHGNHEDMLLNRKFDSKNEPVYQLKRLEALLPASILNWVKGWQKKLFFECPAGRLLFVHGSPIDPLYEYVYPGTDLAPFADMADYVFMGHTHYPFDRQDSGCRYINVGSCGLPRDVGHLGSAVLFNEVSGETRLLRFDIKKETQDALAMIENIHESVLKLYNRDDTEYLGELIED